MEAIIRREFVAPYIKEKLGLEVEVIDPAYMYRSKDNPFMTINPDGFLRVNDKLVGLEIKTGNSYVLPQWGGVNGDEIPDSYYCQVQHYLAGTGLSEWWVFGLIGNNRLLRIIPRNESFIDNLIESERKFWELVELNDPLFAPMPIGSDADDKALSILGNPQQETITDLTSIDYHLNRYLELRTTIDGLTKEKKLQRQRILAAMGTSRFGESEKYKATFSMAKRSILDRKALEKAHPGIVDPFIKISESGRLTIKSK